MNAALLRTWQQPTTIPVLLKLFLQRKICKRERVLFIGTEFSILYYYGNAYTPQNTLDSEDKLFWMKQDAKISREEITNKMKQDAKISREEITNKKTNKRQFQKSHKKSHQADDSWDEEVHGDRVIYDTTYEMNENLVPWLMRPTEWEDKYGFY